MPLPATADIEQVNALLQRIGQEVYVDPELRPLILDAPTVMGGETIDVDHLSIRMVSRTQPGKQFVVGRELRARIATALQEAGIVTTVEVANTRVPPVR